ncbi:MAG: hypothetical protein ACI841_000129 [Planctomycetota bacterium]|jgi:hypothetical protein
MSSGLLQLREASFGVRLGITLLLLVNLGGFVASAAHTSTHHSGRDEREGLSIDDLTGVYHGIQTRAPLLSAIESGHPGELEGREALPEDQKKLLLDWLGSDRVSDDYDSLDLGDNAPAEILDAACIDCHERQTAGEELTAGMSSIPLEYWDDVKRVAFSRDIQPTPTEILTTSTHAHAIALATIALIIVLLLQMTRCSEKFKSLTGACIGIGLAGDLSSWWFAREAASFVYAIVACGTLFAAGIGLASLLIILDMWKPSTDA